MKKHKILRLVLTIIAMAVLYLIYLPPINFQSFAFYSYLFACFIAIMLINVISLPAMIQENGTVDINPKKFSKKWLVVILVVATLFISNGVFFSPVVQAKKYSERITITTGDFLQEIDPINVDSLPLLDKDSSEKIGDRIMGEIPELISQFIVSNEYTQVNVNNHLTRVTPLEYADLIKWFINKSEGIPGYIKVDSTTGEADFIRVDGGINYSPSAFIIKNLGLHLRFSYPFKELSHSRFEIDEEGHPYWITPTIKYQGIGKLKDIEGVIVTDASTGHNEYYDVNEVPEWIDNVYPSKLIIDQIDDWGLYQGGFINSVFGQKDVKVSTEGYTYLTTGNDVSLYTGITSVTQDKSNIGFVLVNLRTKEARFYAAPGAEEYSAMFSAQGAIPEKNYIPTFPLLTNVDGLPTYLLSLKDNAGLVKAYALVNVNNYQKVKVTDANLGIETAINEYRKMMGSKVISDTQEIKGIIEKIEQVVVNGQSFYYFKLIDDNSVYKANIAVSDELPFIEIEDEIVFDVTNDLHVTKIK